MQLARHLGNGRFSEGWSCRQMASNDPERKFAKPEGIAEVLTLST